MFTGAAYAKAEAFTQQDLAHIQVAAGEESLHVCRVDANKWRKQS
jgi:hypothetical protein